MTLINAIVSDVASRRERLIDIMRATACHKERLLSRAEQMADSAVGNTAIEPGEKSVVAMVDAGLESLRAAMASECAAEFGKPLHEMLRVAKLNLISEIKQWRWLPSDLETAEGAARAARSFEGGLEDPF